MTTEEKLARLAETAKDSAILRQTMMAAMGQRLLETANYISGVIGSGGKLLIAGNGGSASDASHFAAELVVRLTSDRNRQALPALALVADPCVMTAAANDYGYDSVFARQVEALGRRGDMFIGISTSGNSPNVVNAARAAREKGMLTLGLLGGQGGKLADLVDRALIVPHHSTQRIQEEHIFIIHLLVELVESDLFG